jgi:hypothetical protein
MIAALQPSEQGLKVDVCVLTRICRTIGRKNP